MRWVCLLSALTMLMLTIYGLVAYPGSQALLASMAPFWGKFVWADVYAGFFLMGTIILTFERNKWVALAIFLAMCVFGNVVAGFWLLWRSREFRRRIAGTALD